MLTIKAAQEIAGTLGYPSKMPGTSYGIPAAACKIGTLLRKIKGSTCHECYAFERGNYIFSSVKKSQLKRLESLTAERWVEAVVALLTAVHKAGKGGKNPKTGEPMSLHHRWHDSGDLQSRDHLAKICAVCRATPWLVHWLPTREGAILKAYIRDGGTIPDNLVIRLSATMIDGAAPSSWPNTSTVHSGKDRDSRGRFIRRAVGHRCPAPQQGNSCGECRACWDKTVATVGYHQH